MRVQLNGELLGTLIKARGGVSAFLGQWSSVNKDAGDAPDRATVYRWMKGETVPQSQSLFLRAAGLLDVDPFALIVVPVSDILAAADEVLRMVQNSYAGPSWLQFVHGFFGRQITWPPQELASAYFSRPWHVEEFSHDANTRNNYYARVLLRQELNPPPGRPQIFHFAFRHPSLFHARWLHYGLVRLQGTSVTLHHINGYIDQLEIAAPDEPIRVETWFGPGPALYRIASLHPFSHSIEAPGEGTDKAVRFPG